MPVKTEVNRKPNKECSQKSRQRVCKVCWLLKDVVIGGDTSFRCSACVLTTYNKKIGEAKPSQVYLCNKLMHAFDVHALRYGTSAGEMGKTSRRNAKFGGRR
ncbi:Hypothetical protein PHPALM_817 [Phytophthora palmivora]|uniref:Uncharacterized protein n=1 Tax=Phytophthora palmivora TaxID=4796 RepID=A0A2P4YTW4_9STRA|nr:Hypothetical protein PHPALM_817 [Phytophthora palmivora]